MKVLMFLKTLFAMYNAIPIETRKEIGEAIASIPDLFTKLITGEEIDLDSITPVLTSEEMEAEFDRAENERLSSGE